MVQKGIIWEQPLSSCKTVESALSGMGALILPLVMPVHNELQCETNGIRCSWPAVL